MQHPILTKIKSLLIILVATVALAGSSVGTHQADWWGPAWRAVVATAAFLFLVAAVDRRVKFAFQKPPTSNVEDSQNEFSVGNVSHMRKSAADRDISADQARLFAMSIVAPATVRERLIETYEANSRTLHQHSAVDLRVNASIFKESKSPEGRQYLPLLIPEKGELLDGLRVFDADHKPVRTLPYREYLSLMATVLHTLVVAAQVDGVDTINSEIAVLEQALMELITRPSSDLTPNDLKDSEDWLDELTRLSADKDLAELLTNLVSVVITHYVVVACVDLPADGVAKIYYEQVVVPSPVGPGVKISRSGIKQMVQLILGARPMFVGVPLSYAWTCESYHLQVKGPDGLYLAHQAVVLGGTQSAPGKRESPAGDSPTEPATKPGKYYTFQRRLGQGYGHFYARSFPASALGNARRPEARFTFYETPPGSDFQASVAAISAFLLIWLIGFIVTNTHAAGHDILGSDAPVLLLAFPGVAASWVGFETRPGLLSRSLSAVLSLIGTAAFSIGGSALFMFHNGEIWTQKLGHTFPGGFSLLGVDNVWWGLLIALSLLNALMISYRYVVRSRLYDRLSSRPSFGVGDSRA